MSDQVPGIGRAEADDAMPECSPPGVPMASGFEAFTTSIARLMPSLVCLRM